MAFSLIIASLFANEALGSPVSNIFRTIEAKLPFEGGLGSVDVHTEVLESRLARSLWGDADHYRRQLEAGGEWDVTVETWARVESSSDEDTVWEKYHDSDIQRADNLTLVSRWQRVVTAKHRARGTFFGENQILLLSYLSVISV